MLMNRPRWLRKLQDPLVKFIVIDSVPDAFSLKHAALIIPTATPATAARLTLNGEWRFSLSLPRRRSPRQVRSDVTLIYDVMENISQSLKQSPSLAIRHPDLAQLNQSGYLPERFVSPELGGGLCRQEGEVNRPQLWERIQSYLGGDRPLYCRPEHADGRPIAWEELLLQGTVLSGGVGVSRQVLSETETPFQDIYRQPTRFHFFTPTPKDVSYPSGLVLNSGRSQLSTEPARTVYALATFNSGKSASGPLMPDDNPLFISMSLAERMDLKAGDRVWVTHLETRTAMILNVQPTSLLLGETLYISMHKSKVELAQARHVNNLTGHSGRCPYTGQTTLKLTQVRLEKAESPLR
jgi:anaerobic selenocysteine-containing dehydrogenase